VSDMSGDFPVQLATRLPDRSAGGLLRCIVLLPVCPCVVSFSKFHDLLRTSSRVCHQDDTRIQLPWNFSLIRDVSWSSSMTPARRNGREQAPDDVIRAGQYVTRKCPDIAAAVAAAGDRLCLYHFGLFRPRPPRRGGGGRVCADGRRDTGLRGTPDSVQSRRSASR